jgi:hypothetical protein
MEKPLTKQTRSFRELTLEKLNRLIEQHRGGLPTNGYE